MELRTDKIRACFDRKIGNFTELWNLSTNTNYVRCAPRDPLIELYGLKNGERVKLPGHISDVAEGIEQIGERFGNVCRLRNEKLEETKKMLEQAFSFLEECFGEGQELLLFETGLTGDDRCSIFISQYGCPSYFKHCELLLYSKKENELRKECRDLLED